MFNRAKEIILQREYQAKTNEVRLESEKFSGILSRQKEEFERLGNINEQLRLDNNNLTNYNLKLNEEIEKQKVNIESNNKEIQKFAQEKEVLLREINLINNQLDLLKIDNNKLSIDKSEKENNINDLNNKTKECQTFFNKLESLIGEELNKLNLLKKEESDKIQELAYKENKLIELFNKVNNEKAINISDRKKLDKYKERLNKSYKKLGINITL